jgi:hypothetical protein
MQLDYLDMSPPLTARESAEAVCTGPKPLRYSPPKLREKDNKRAKRAKKGPKNRELFQISVALFYTLITIASLCTETLSLGVKSWPSDIFSLYHAAYMRWKALCLPLLLKLNLLDKV